MTRLYHAVKRSYTSVDSYSFSGPVLFDGNEYKKLKFDDLGKTPGHADGEGRLARGDPASLRRGRRSAGRRRRDATKQRRAARTSY